jgi:transposase
MYYVGIDHHKKSNAITVMDQDGTIIKRITLSNDKNTLDRFFNSIPGPCSVVFESSRDWSVLYDNLEDIAEEIHLANPYKTRIIAEAKIKTDKIDSEILAHLLRSKMIPKAHIPSKIVRRVRYLLRQRLFFVRLRTMVKNRIHHLVDRNHLGATVTASFTDLFGKKGMVFLKEAPLPDSERKLLDEQLSLLEELNRLVKEDDRRIRKLFDKDHRVTLVATVPGLGHLLSALVVYEIDTIDRFLSPKKLHSYAGLVPSTYASGEKSYHGRLTKAGNRYLRWAMVEAVGPAISKDPGLRRYFHQIRVRNGVNAAKIAVARRLLTIVYRILKEQRPYWPGSVTNNQNRSRVALAKR